MSEVVIKVENLSKKYILSHQSQERYTALRDVLANGAKNLGQKLFSPKTSNLKSKTETSEEFYALKDVSFEIKQGDRVGIIGRNGAGKSTLLKILSRITEPTSGKIEITGRVASLLEVGTGFHPELTGRENIFLNGAILGMGKVEIKRKFDEIVAFAEVEKFLDTPVKRYSSGMYVRLAFAVAAYLEPEILIVDEVLAVGDAQFQQKCLGKMEEVGKEGRTVLFVSHNMGAISRLCQRAILLSAGQNVCQGEVETVIHSYRGMADTVASGMAERSENPDKIYQILSVSGYTKDGVLIDRPLNVTESFTIKIDCKLGNPLPGGYATLEVKNQNGDFVFLSDNRDNLESAKLEKPGYFSISIYINQPLLVPGKYFITTSIARPITGCVDAFIDAIIIDIEDTQGIRTSRPGSIYIPFRWQLDSTTS